MRQRVLIGGWERCVHIVHEDERIIERAENAAEIGAGDREHRAGLAELGAGPLSRACRWSGRTAASDRSPLTSEAYAATERDAGYFIDGNRLQQEGHLGRAAAGRSQGRFETTYVAQILFVAHGFFADPQ